MRITSIELAGTSETTLRDGSPGLPGAFARICRTQADDRDDQWSMAQILQHALDGYEGTNSEIEEYARVLQYFAD